MPRPSTVGLDGTVAPRTESRLLAAQHAVANQSDIQDFASNARKLLVQLGADLLVEHEKALHRAAVEQRSSFETSNSSAPIASDQAQGQRAMMIDMEELQAAAEQHWAVNGVPKPDIMKIPLQDIARNSYSKPGSSVAADIYGHHTGYADGSDWARKVHKPSRELDRGFREEDRAGSRADRSPKDRSPKLSERSAVDRTRTTGSKNLLFELRQTYKTVSRLDSSVHGGAVDLKMLGRSGSDWSVGMSRKNLKLANAGEGIIAFYEKCCGTRTGCMISPASPFYLWWNIMFMVVLCYELMMFPMVVFDIPESGALLAVQIFAIAFWSLDILIACSVGFYDGNGDVVMDRCRVVAKYVRTWMTPDVLILTVDILLVAVLDGTDQEEQAGATKLLRMGRAVRYLRTLRVMRLLRIRKIFEAVRVVDEFFNSEVFSITKSMFLNVVAILVISHFLGCLWFFVGSQNIDHYDSWVQAGEFENVAWEYQYLTSVHWSLTQITPGSMDVQPQNVPERFIAILVLVLGMIIFSSIVSSITAATNQLKSINARYERQRWTLRRFFREKEISRKLTNRVTRYTDNILKSKMRQIAQQDVELMPKLPTSMYMEVMLELYDQDLEVHPLFKALNRQSKVVMQKVCTSVLETRILAEGDYLFHWGEEAHSMYFVKRGRLEYAHGYSGSQERRGKTKFLEPGSWACEMVLWTPWVHSGDMRAVTDGEVHSIDHERFETVIQQHRADIWLTRKYATVFVGRLNEMTHKHNENPDVQAAEINMSDLLVIQAAIDTLPKDDPNAPPVLPNGA